VTPVAMRKTKTNDTNTSAQVGLAVSSLAIEARLDAVDRSTVRSDLDAQRWAIAPQRLTRAEFVLTEQPPRIQTRVIVVPLNKDDAAVSAVNSRPMKGLRGDYQVKVNDGGSKLYSGKRHTVSVISHDAV
jgi:hypothetical protein